MTLLIPRVFLIVILNQALTDGASKVKRILPSDIFDTIKKSIETEEANEENVVETSSTTETTASMKTHDTSITTEKTTETATEEVTTLKTEDKNHITTTTTKITEILTEEVTTVAKKKEDLDLSPSTTENPTENVTKKFKTAHSNIDNTTNILNYNKTDGSETFKVEVPESNTDEYDYREDYFFLSDGDYYNYYENYQETVETTTVFTLPVFRTQPATDALKIKDKLKNIKYTNQAFYVMTIIFVCFFISFSIACFFFIRIFSPIDDVQSEEEEVENV